MVNYQNGKIYRIDCLTTGKVYIGSTTKKTVAQRLAEHVTVFKRWKEGKTKYTSFQIIEQGNYKITLIESYPCNSKDELTSREGHYIRTMECVNKYIAGRTSKVYYEEHKEVILEQQKEYRKEHKVQIVERQKEYYQEHKEQIAERQKEYYQELKEQNAEYYQERKDQISERNKKTYTCPCGRTIRVIEKNRHAKSAFHIKNIVLV